MARVATRPNIAVPSLLSLLDIDEYQRDTEASLYLYFAPTNPAFATIFAGEFPSEVQRRLSLRVDETDTRSALVVMSRIEAAFQIDYKRRCDGKKPDPVSVEFRRISRLRGRKARLDEDIWETWRNAMQRQHPSLVNCVACSNSDIGLHMAVTGGTAQSTTIRHFMVWPQSSSALSRCTREAQRSRAECPLRVEREL